MNLYKYVSDEINTKLGFTAKLEVPKNRDFGDFSTNAAMVGAKSAGKNPRELAAEILPKIFELDFVADATIAGPGFINIKLKNTFIWDSVNEPRTTSHEPRFIIDLDYGGYNVGKSLHIGHLRTTVVGDTFNRIAKFLGHKTKSYNHLGDWGRPMGLIIAWILENGMPQSADELNAIYPASTIRAKENPEWLEHAKQITSQLQAGNAEYKKIYDAFMEISLGQMSDILRRLNIMPFDENMGERGVAEYVPDVQKILDDKKILISDDGAEIIPVKTDADTAPMPPLMWRTSADTQTYAAADLTAIWYRTKTDNPDVIGYFTDSRQNLHFQQVFRAAKIAELSNADLFHVGFGAVTGTDGKPFKTRDGGVATLVDMLDMTATAVKNRVLESGKNLDDETINSIALAALKFNDLMHDVRADYIFDPNTVTSFEGRTGPYILYTAVRLNSILRKTKDEKRETNLPLATDERNLLLGILDFERTVTSAFDNRATDILANYTYDLAQLINTFYHNCPILRPDVDNATRAIRVQIATIARDTLARAIDLMGLKIPESM